MMKWQEEIAKGMAMIMEGCAMNPSWTDCGKCPFDEFCTAIYKDKDCAPYTTPDSWESEGFRFE